MRARYAVMAVAATLMIGCAKAEEPATTDEASSAATAGANADHVRAAVQRHFDAVGSGNAAALDSLTAADLVHVDAAGDVHNEQQVIEAYRAAPVKYTAEQIDVRVYGDVAVVNARVVDPANKKLHVTQVWTMRHGPATAAAPASNRAVKLVSRPRLIAQVYDTDGSAYEMVAMHVSAMSEASASEVSAGAAAADGAASADAANTSEAQMNKPAN